MRSKQGRSLSASVVGAAALTTALTAALTGCGAEASVSTKPKELDGKTLAARANTQLEKSNPQLVHGDLTCADVAFKVGATSACMRTVVFDDGRLVRIGATVLIDRVKDGGHFKIQVADAPTSFGLTGKSVLADLAKQYAAQYKAKVPTGSCPAYLAGKQGTTMLCVLDTAKGKQRVEVKVTSVDAKNFATGYTFKTVA